MKKSLFLLPILLFSIQWLFPLSVMSQDVAFDITKVNFSEEMANFSDSIKYEAFINRVEAATDSELYTSFFNLNFEKIELNRQNYDKHLHLMRTRKSKYEGYLWLQTHLFELILYGNTLSENAITSICNQIKQTAITKQPPLDIFMRVWSFAILTFNNRKFYDKAFEEAQLMIKEAKQINYHEGLIYVNGTVARMLYKQRLYKQSIAHYKEAISSIQHVYREERKRPLIGYEDINYHMYLSTLAESLLAQVNAGEYKMGKETMSEIERLCENESNYTDLALYARALFYNKMGDDENFWKTTNTYKSRLDKLGFLKHPEKAGWQISFVYYYYQILAEYYLSHQQPAKALEYCRMMDNIRPTPRTTAQALLGTEQYKEAAQIYQNLYEEMDSLYLYDQSNTVGKFAAFMENENLQLKYLRTQMEVQKIQLSLNRLFLGATIVVILIGAGFLYRNAKLMKRVRVSKSNLRIKNKELIRKEKDVREALAQAEEASRVKISFLNNITHEMRTPLNGVVGFTQLLTAHTDEELLIINEIQSNTSLLLQLINTTIELSNYDTVDKELVFKNIDLNTCCLVAKEQVNLAMSPNVSFHWHFPQERFLVYSNDEALIKLLICLLHNAIKFTEQGEIEIGYLPGEGNVQIYVQDTGKGISADKAEWIFERFSKIDEFVPGFGLGLPLANAIANRLHGKLKLDNEYTQGSRFVLTLTTERNTSNA